MCGNHYTSPSDYGYYNGFPNKLQLQHIGRRERMYAKYVELRDAKGVNDANVSEATGIPRSTFTDWKTGRSTPKLEKLVKIAGYFEVPIDDFVKAR